MEAFLRAQATASVIGISQERALHQHSLYLGYIHTHPQIHTYMQKGRDGERKSDIQLMNQDEWMDSSPSAM